jgi:hypothetical protein
LPDKRDWNPAQIKDPNPSLDTVYRSNDIIPENSSFNLPEENPEYAGGPLPLLPFLFFKIIISA